MFKPYQSGAQQSTPPVSWYPSSGIGPPSVTPYPPFPNSSSSSGVHPLTRGNTSRSSNDDFRPQTPSLSHSSNAADLRDKSVEELRKLLSDKEAYAKFLHTLEEVKHLDTLRNDLRKSNVDLARHNLGKEAESAELRNQCTIIRTTELAAAREKFEDVQKMEKEMMASFSSSALLDKLQAANDTDEESERLHQKLLARELEFNEFIQTYKKQRALYHRRMLTRLAATTSMTMTA
ncbi:hypothetical protein O6H91_03G086700 [Diphasiastrum complanatum]|uniref:Uncharacterized protein n=1 Tax=Diphasiastrum complanatum TaxID=34168 RepID=A0ACC2E8N5_DIPCM|nr:hypothetical protein O6H91_03G086700 [Diphasiastrum complanatum]